MELVLELAFLPIGRPPAATRALAEDAPDQPDGERTTLPTIEFNMVIAKCS